MDMTKRTGNWEESGDPFEEEEGEDGLNILSGDDEEAGEEEVAALFALGQQCDVCSAEEGRVGIDPTCRGSYDGDPVLLGDGCLDVGLKSAYEGIEGAAVVVEPFGQYVAHYYYRVDEMPAYRFVRDDVEAISWLLLTVGDDCARCGQQSRFVWLPADRVDAKLPEDRALFRGLDAELQHLCNICLAAQLAESYRSLDLLLITAEVPRAAMGIVIPTAE
jgi:hypothetical protein